MLLFLVLNLIAVLVFIRLPKQRSPFEILGCWLIVVIIHQDWLTISSVNLDLIKTNHQTMTALIVMLNRTVLLPILINLYLEVFTQVQSYAKKLASFVMLVSIFVILQYASDKFNLYQLVKWSIWWSVVIWSAEAVLMIGCQALFKRLFERMKTE